MFTTRDMWSVAWFNDPVILGTYPDDGLERFGRHLPTGWERDLEVMHQPLDSFGANVYRARTVSRGPNGSIIEAPLPIGYRQSAFGWHVAPDALYWSPRLLFERYGVPIYITENGMSNVDWVEQDGSIHDPQRISFIRDSLASLERAIEEGVPINGYFHWSLMDNFEWAAGYTQRFGLVHVDFETQQRRLKDSAIFYAELIRGTSAAPRSRSPRVDQTEKGSERPIRSSRN